MKEKSKYYFDTERNKSFEKDERIPDYYIGIDGTECRKIIFTFLKCLFKNIFLVSL